MNKLYYEMPYEREVTATVTAVEGNMVFFDKTIFYPEGGGQPGDRGVFNGYEIVDTRKVGDEVAHIFNSTAERIMHLTTTTKDVAKYAIIAVIAIVIVGGGITVLVLKYRRQRQEAQETIEILKTPIDTSDTIADDLADKYAGQDHQ